MNQYSNTDLPSVIGHVSVFNRTNQPPLPFETKHIKLVWSRCSDSERPEILKLLPKKNKLADDFVIGEKRIEMQVGGVRSVFPLRRYRDKFEAFGESNAKDIYLSDPPPIHLNFDAEYVETEDAAPISIVDVMEHLTGTKNPIVLGDLESLRRIGPVAARRTAAWDARTAGIIAHFLAVVRFIHNSAWMREPAKLVFIEAEDKSSRSTPSTFPSMYSFAAVAPFLRQLYDRRSTDNLLLKACQLYLYFSDHDGKSFWLQHELKSAQDCLLGPPFAMDMDDVSNLQLLDAFMYGARVMHAVPHSGGVEQADELIQQYGVKRIAYAAHSAFKNFFGQCLLIACAIHIDFSYWTEVQILPVKYDDAAGRFFGKVS